MSSRNDGTNPRAQGINPRGRGSQTTLADLAATLAAMTAALERIETKLTQNPPSAQPKLTRDERGTFAPGAGWLNDWDHDRDEQSIATKESARAHLAKARAALHPSPDEEPDPEDRLKQLALERELDR